MAELPQGPAGESTNGKPKNLAGVYRHEASGKELIVLPDFINGSPVTAQGDALVRLGYVRVADAPSREELLKMQTAQAQAEKNGEITVPEAPAPDAPKFNGTATTLEADLAAATERAAQAEAALAALQAEPQAEETVASDELQPEAETPVKRTPAKRKTNKKGK